MNAISRELNIDLPIESIDSANDSTDIEDADNVEDIENSFDKEILLNKTDANTLDSLNQNDDNIELSVSNSEKVSKLVG